MSEGHNSNAENAQLRSFVERVERLEEDKANIAADIREVYAEAKAQGFDVKVMRQVVRIRKMDPTDRREQEELLDIYMRALGMLADTPLGHDAVRRAAERLGTPVPLTDSEREKGVVAAFDNDGTRVSVGFPERVTAK